MGYKTVTTSDDSGQSLSQSVRCGRISGYRALATTATASSSPPAALAERIRLETVSIQRTFNAYAASRARMDPPPAQRQVANDLARRIAADCVARREVLVPVLVEQSGMVQAKKMDQEISRVKEIVLRLDQLQTTDPSFHRNLQSAFDIYIRMSGGSPLPTLETDEAFTLGDRYVAVKLTASPPLESSDGPASAPFDRTSLPQF
ncbi:hypothetical protein BJ742DRAFT_793538 [Cladochytrium replicatum]|nr:hypothetical protein BJ742DRAFT_793538 [Cladochytrium replicatum]